ncbi:DHA3 family macrolide efflux protein-like MFS transporter [Aequitasia blattaphilus]|uniref:MFS transporter n=1 Tax=Aequitasia blattaphilus TaxID=2949332 RepID=A0ABT1EBT8_9FIRM|nr:MFS transporter [Aequitasia blattaphilus]MCP1103306.1 MFS transporter [Aequitasia blattaphilus]MCR8615946.1 MFS transporter [Aequitasia blattaphilus]
MKYNWKRNTIIFLASQSISLFGSSVVQFAITSYITVTTKSGLYATLSIICAILPMFFLSPVGGVWADKYNRKMLIVLSDAGIALCTLGVAIAFLMGKESIAYLFIALIIRAVGGAIQTPCVGAMLPDIVPPEHLARINGINGTLQSVFTLASPMLGAALLPIAPLGVIFFVDIITAMIGVTIMVTAFVLPQKERIDKKASDFFQDIKLGVRYIRNTRFLMEFFLFCLIFFIMMAPAAFLTPIQVVRNYGDGYWRLSAIEVAFSVGMIVGGILITIWSGFKNKVTTMIAAALIMGMCTIGLGIPMPFFPYTIIMGAFGLAMPILNTPAMTLLQEKVDPDYMGRVFGVMTMINTAMMPLGMVIFGPLADVVSVEILLIGTGVITVAAAVMMRAAKALIKEGV